MAAVAGLDLELGLHRIPGIATGAGIFVALGMLRVVRPLQVVQVILDRTVGPRPVA